MKFIFPLLSIFICGAAAYFSYDQSKKFQENQDVRLLAISTNKSVTASADKADIQIENEQELLEESKKNRDIVTASVQSLESDATRLKSELRKVDDELGLQDVEKEQLNKALEQVQKIFVDMNLGDDININNLAEKISEIDEDIKTKRAKNEELEALIEGVKKSLANKQDEVASLVSRKDARNTRIGHNALEARVTAVDSDWGFLVIGAGANSGFTPQTTLLVMRDGRLIGKVNPSAVEPTQTIAEIDLKSIATGVRIQPGDSVIIAKPAVN